MKKTISTLLIVSSLLLSGCGSRMGEMATNIDKEGNLISTESNAFIDKNVIDNVKTILTAPKIDDLKSFEFKSSLTDEKYGSELKSRKDNFILTAEDTKVESQDIVNLSFMQVYFKSENEAEGGNSQSVSYSENVGYDIDLKTADASFKAGLEGKTIDSGTLQIKNCKMPDGRTADVDVRINYIIRSAENLDFLLNEEVKASFSTYDEWFKAELEKREKIDELFANLIQNVTIQNDEDGEVFETYEKYKEEKYNNALEYYQTYGVEVNADELKKTIYAQCNKELVAHYYAKELGITLGDYSDSDMEKVAMFYGYSVEGFKAKYTDKSTVDKVVFIDTVGNKLFDKINKK